MKLAVTAIILLLFPLISIAQLGGVYHGYRIDSNKAGNKIREGMYKNGRKVGRWIYYRNGTDTSYTFEPLGGRTYYLKLYADTPNFVDREGVMEQYGSREAVKDRPIGKWLSYYFKDGQRHLLKELYYKEGKLHGDYLHNEIAFNATIKGQYKDSLKSGEWRFYDMQNDSLYAIEHYEKGKLQGSYEYYNRQTHNLMTKGSHAKGMRVGTWSFFDSTTGQLLKTENYLAGTLHGDYLLYDEQGLLLESGQYKKGIKTGIWKYYDKITRQLITHNFDEVASGSSMVGSADWDDTAYYYKNLNPGAEKAEAWYFRPPVEKIDDTHYRISYYRMNGLPYMVATALPGWVEDRYSLEIGKGVYDGPILFYDSLGYKKSEGAFINGKASGEWTRYRSATNLVNYKSTKLENNDYYLKIYRRSPNVPVSEGAYEKVVINGIETMKLKGKWFSRFPNGDTQKVSFYNDEGKLHGPLRLYDSATHTITLSGQYINGKQEGNWSQYDGASGRLLQSRNFENGLLHGKKMEWNTAGNLIEEMNYEKGLFDGSQNLYFAGTTQVKARGKFEDGNGTMTYYDSATGAVILVGAFRNGKRHGSWKQFYNGTDVAMRLSNYRNGRLHGKMTHYNRDGKLIRLDEFENSYKKKMVQFYNGTENPWFEYIFLPDSNNKMIALKTYYSTGALKRHTYIDQQGNMIQKNFDPYGEEIPWTPIQTIPKFSGDVMTYIGNNLRYPEEAKDMRLEGKVVVSFMVNEDGTLSDIYVQEGFDPRCDDEAVRLVSNMPLWKPAEVDGVPFKMQQSLPIVFWLPEQQADVE